MKLIVDDANYWQQILSEKKMRIHLFIIHQMLRQCVVNYCPLLSYKQLKVKIIDKIVKYYYFSNVRQKMSLLIITNFILANFSSS